jgi:hypothetical protein
MTELMKWKGIERLMQKARNYQTDVGVLNEMVACFSDMIESLQAENTNLKAQLTWRPVSEKPKESGWYFGRFSENNYPIAVYYDGYVFCDKDGRLPIIDAWLPIPPAPEGEAK